ncbi:MAG: formate dehydrogenase subunit delta [Gammaproteobacteria bacterium]|nr:formate dehydrogenase subunit delta [Gammaproteobacteria bacterium]
MNPDKLIRMVNQIAAFFAHEGAEQGAASVADHLRKFWDPRMRAELLAAVAAGHATALVPLAKDAVARLAAGASASKSPAAASAAAGH